MLQRVVNMLCKYLAWSGSEAVSDLRAAWLAGLSSSFWALAEAQMPAYTWLPRVGYAPQLGEILLAGFELHLLGSAAELVSAAPVHLSTSSHTTRTVIFA